MVQYGVDANLSLSLCARSRKAPGQTRSATTTSLNLTNLANAIADRPHLTDETQYSNKSVI